MTNMKYIIAGALNTFLIYETLIYDIGIAAPKPVFLKNKF